MAILRIEHAVADYAAWKEAFDGDPVGREHSGVRSYRIMRPADDDRFVLIDLEFDTAQEAEGLLAAMRGVWSRVSGTLINEPRTRIVESVETRTYGRLQNSGQGRSIS
jgi:hypothetical protein